MDDLDSSETFLYSFYVSNILTCITICESFLHHTITNTKSNNRSSKIISYASSKRLEDNVDGVIYVNENVWIINVLNIQLSISSLNIIFYFYSIVSASHVQYLHQMNLPILQIVRNFIITKQPKNTINEELSNARAAMSACPVGAIRVENLAQRNHNGLQKLTNEESELTKSLILNEKTNDITL